MMRRPGIPVFFYIWFVFCAALALSIGTATVMVLLNPEWIGEFVGRIVQGYSQAVSVTPAQPPPV